MNKEYFMKTDNLAVWRPKGVLSTKKILEFITFLNEQCKQQDPHFNRFIDLSHISGVSVNYDDLYHIAEQRKIYYAANIKQTVKMAFLAKNPFSYGMARMYIVLSTHPLLKVNISKNMKEVSDFLEIDISLLDIK